MVTKDDWKRHWFHLVAVPFSFLFLFLFFSNKHSLLHWTRPPSRNVWAISFNWQWTENELWTPHALLVRTRAIHCANVLADFSPRNQMLWLLIKQQNVVCLLLVFFLKVELFGVEGHKLSIFKAKCKCKGKKMILALQHNWLFLTFNTNSGLTQCSSFNNYHIHSNRRRSLELGVLPLSPWGKIF